MRKIIKGYIDYEDLYDGMFITLNENNMYVNKEMFDFYYKNIYNNTYMVISNFQRYYIEVNDSKFILLNEENIKLFKIEEGA